MVCPKPIQTDKTSLNGQNCPAKADQPRENADGSSAPAWPLTPVHHRSRLGQYNRHTWRHNEIDRESKTPLLGRCRTCRFHWPAQEAPRRSKEIVASLRLGLKILENSSPADRARRAKDCEELLTAALKLRTDLSLPIAVFHADLKNPVERFKTILEYILTSGHGYCAAAFLDNRDPMLTTFAGEAAVTDWCLHPDHQAAIHRTTGCQDILTKEASF